MYIEFKLYDINVDLYIIYFYNIFIYIVFYIFNIMLIFFIFRSDNRNHSFFILFGKPKLKLKPRFV